MEKIAEFYYDVVKGIPPERWIKYPKLYTLAILFCRGLVAAFAIGLVAVPSVILINYYPWIALVACSCVIIFMLGIAYSIVIE